MRQTHQRCKQSRLGSHPGCEVTISPGDGNVLFYLDWLHSNHLAALIHLLQQLVYPASSAPAMMPAHNMVCHHHMQIQRSET